MANEIHWFTPDPKRPFKTVTADLVVTKVKVTKYEYLRFSFKSEICELMSSHTYRIGADFENKIVYVAADSEGYALAQNVGTRKRILVQTKMFSNHEDDLIGEYVYLSTEDGALVFERRCE